MKVCRDCGESKPLTDFYKQRGKARSYCKPCDHARNARNKKRTYTPERHRDLNLRKKYGITLDQYNQMLAAQGGVCAICGEAEYTGRGDHLHVDHCHRTGKVRALLCMECNTGLGKFRDNPDLLRVAALYLEKHACHQSP